MKINLVCTFLFLFFFFKPQNLMPQENEDSYDAFGSGLELNTKYVWRGIPFGDAPVLFPNMSYTHKGFNVMALGGYALNGSHSEVDWFFTYSFKNISLGLNDYFFPDNSAKNNHYLNFNPQESLHTVEACFTYTFPKVPIWLTASTFVFGYDRDENGDNYFSTYLEAGYTWQISGNDKFSFILGATPAKGFYSDDFGIVNTALKYDTSIPFESYRLPVSGSFVINPDTENVFLSFSVYLNK